MATIYCSLFIYFNDASRCKRNRDDVMLTRASAADLDCSQGKFPCGLDLKIIRIQFKIANLSFVIVIETFLICVM